MKSEGEYPIVSVIMPAYNAELYIENAISSVLRQTYNDFELIIIDDASTDSTLDVIQGLCEKDSRIRVIPQNKNQGVAASRNLGIANALGIWIAFLDSDDLWRGDKLEKQLKLAGQVNGRFLFTASSFIDENGNRLEGLLQVAERVDRRSLLRQNIISCSSVLINKELLVKHPMPEGLIHEDFVTWLRILQEEKYAYGINEPLLVYRRTMGSKSGNKVKSAMMTYKVYLKIGLNPVAAFYYWVHYVIRSVKKYHKITKP